MNTLILAAGFGTRLERSAQEYCQHGGPHLSYVQKYILGRAKGLVRIGEACLLDHVWNQLRAASTRPEEMYIQTNALYYQQYLSWSNQKNIPPKNVNSNGVLTNEQRLGTIEDLQMALYAFRLMEKPLLVVASDTLILTVDHLPASLREIMEGYERDGLSRIVVYPGKKERLTQHGIVEIDSEQKIVGFEEKPLHPKSHLVNASVHLYNPACLAKIAEYQGPVDHHGQLLEYLHARIALYVHLVPHRLDIGTVEDLLDGLQSH